MHLKALFVLTCFILGINSFAHSSEAGPDSKPLVSDRFSNGLDGLPNSCFFKMSDTKKMVALTFDDGPTKVSRAVVRLLKEYNAKATFFWLGENLAAHSKFVKETAQKHQLANHSWDHSNGEQSICEDLWQNQVLRTNMEFQKFGLPSPVYYRPPYGAITEQQENYLLVQGISTVLWSVSTQDWDPNKNTSQKIVDQFKSGLSPGAIVLLHDRGFNDEGQRMLKALREILEFGTDKGYQFVTIQEILK